MTSINDLRQARGKWAMDKNVYRERYNHVLQYSSWKRELANITGSVKSPALTGLPHGNGSSDPTQELAIRRAILAEEIFKVEDVAYRVGFRYGFEGLLLKWVTTEGLSYDILSARYGVLPVGRHKAHELRREFYYRYNEEMNKMTLNHLT